MNKQRLEYLFQKYFDKTASQPERKELLQYIDITSDEEITSLMKKAFDTHENEESFSLPNRREEVLNAVFSKDIKLLEDESHTQYLRKSKSWFKYASIAALLLISLTVSILFYNNYFAASPTEINLVDIEPGGNKAVLTLANGTTIDLDNVSNGEIANEMGVKISKTANGHLVYNLSKFPTTENAKLVYNSIKTPRGGQYQLILPDGSKVWLNAESTLKYPANFPLGERRVELTGEGYFEIAKNEDSPFVVETNRQQVTVLGTHFNVNSYKENKIIKTTLLEGSVKISNSIINKYGKTFSKNLKPGEEAVLDNQNDIKVNTVDVSNSIAWKNGLFHFENTDIKEVMDEFSRWYDVDVVFEGKVPNIKLWGRIYRNVSASEALGILGYFNLKYRIVNDSDKNERKKIIISHA